MKSSRRSAGFGDARKARVKVIGTTVRKQYGADSHDEFEKARQLWMLSRTASFIAPEPLALVENDSVDFEYIAHDGDAKQLFVDYMTSRSVKPHRLPGLLAKVGAALGCMHAELRFQNPRVWRPSVKLLGTIARFGYSSKQLCALTTVPLHCDFCLQNILVRYEDSEPVPIILDSSPDFISTFHPCTVGPAYVDIGLFLSGLAGRVPIRHYPAIRWNRIALLKSAFLDAYERCTVSAIDRRLADVFAYAIAANYFRAKYRFEIISSLALKCLYNRFKANLPDNAAWHGP